MISSRCHQASSWWQRVWAGRAPAEGRIASLQILRATAALLVLFQHATDVFAPMASPGGMAFRRSFGPFGSSGVDLFFVISGFVIAHNISSTRSTAPHLFLLGRMIRILPLFWLMSAIFAVQILSTGVAIAPAIWINTLTLIPITGNPNFIYPLLFVGWSLAFELAFYMITAVTLALPRRWRTAILLPLLLSLATAALIRGPSGGAPAIFLNAIMIEFALGVAAWMIWRAGLTAHIAGCLFSIGVVLFVSGLCVNVGQGFQTSAAEIITDVTSLRRSLVWGLPAAMMVLGLVAAPPLTGTVSKILGLIGNASFSLYLLHPLVFFQIGRMHLLDWVGHDPAFMAILLAIPIALALAMHHLVERPLMRWAKIASARPSRSSRDETAIFSGQGRRGALLPSSTAGAG
jgi:peptidoglycan/LPS O-acetylase OafA/YrhL